MITVERVHYYSDYDMSIPMHIERMADVVRSYEEGNQPDGINDYLEKYHIVQFIEHGKYPQDWDENKIAAIKQYKGKVAAYFSHLQSNDLPVIFGEIERGYESSVWQIINQFKIKGLITENGLREILKEKNWLLKDLLEHRWIVEQNQILLTALLKENEHTAEWLLEQYVEENRFCQHRDLYFPKSLSGQDKDAIIRNYVNSDKANLNYVRLVLAAKRSADFPLHPLTIKAARKKEKALNEAIFAMGAVHVASYGVALTVEQSAPAKERKVDEEGRTMFVYNKKFIDDCKDATVIYYCGQVFEFTEPYGFITLISKDAETDAFEKVTGLHARNAYDLDMAFRMRENMSYLQMQALECALLDTDRNIEGVIKAFYEDFLKTEYGYKGLSLTLPKHDNSLILKIRSLAIEMDAVAHQYDCYVNYGSIDKDIVELTPPQKLTETKSLLSHRYCILNRDNTDVWYLIYLFFGSQSMLFFVEPCKDAHFRNYYEFLENGIEVKYEDYENYQRPDIDRLLEKGYLVKDEKGILRCVKMREVRLLKHLYEYGACSYWGYPKEERMILDDMVSKGWISLDNHLLSPAERDYFSYYLNNEKFTNGPAIRNNYAHGTTPSYSEEKHKKNYFQLLVLFVLLLLKISEDLDMKRYLGKYGLE